MSITLFILLPLSVWNFVRSAFCICICIKQNILLYSYSGLCLAVKPFNATRYTQIVQYEWDRKMKTHLTKSGRRSNTFGCACFNVFDGDMTTVHANTSSVDNSMGCEGVLSSRVYKIIINMEILLTHTYHIEIL